MDCTVTLIVIILDKSLCVWRWTEDLLVLYALSALAHGLPIHLALQMSLGKEKLFATLSFEFISVAIAHSKLFKRPQASEYGSE